MRSDIQQLIADTPAQRSREWYKARLGHFTGSQVGRLMKNGRGGDLSADAYTYISEIVSERLINPVVLDVDELTDEYIEATAVTSRAMAWGIDNELNAVKVYEKLTAYKVTSCGALQHETIHCFWDSPDGLLLEQDGTIEVKCPQVRQHAVFLGVQTAEELKAENPVYYWQCLSHTAVTGASFCDFISYNPFIKPSIHIVRIHRNDEDIHALIQRIKMADSIATERVKQLRHQTELIYG